MLVVLVKHIMIRCTARSNAQTRSGLRQSRKAAARLSSGVVPYQTDKCQVDFWRRGIATRALCLADHQQRRCLQRPSAGNCQGRMTPPISLSMVDCLSASWPVVSGQLLFSMSLYCGCERLSYARMPCCICSSTEDTVLGLLFLSCH